MDTHVTILGWFQIVAGLIDLLLAALLFSVIAGVGLLGLASGSPLAGLLGGTLGVVVGGIVALSAVPNLVAGWGLLTRREWCRILTLVMAAINAFKVPWGTALAVYSFWALTRPEAERLFVTDGR